MQTIWAIKYETYCFVTEHVPLKGPRRPKAEVLLGPYQSPIGELFLKK